MLLDSNGICICLKSEQRRLVSVEFYKARKVMPAMTRAATGDNACLRAPLSLPAAPLLPPLLLLAVVLPVPVGAGELVTRLEVTTAEVATRETVAVPSSTLM